MPQSGFYGKLPALGDFVARGLPREFVAAWDEWLQRAVAGAAAGGADWGARYDAAAPFRFAFEADVCGRDAVLGVCAPGRDRVGRRFPLTLACALPPGASATLAALRAEAWFAELEAAAGAAAGGCAPEELEARLARALPLLGEPRAASADVEGCRAQLAASGRCRIDAPQGSLGAALGLLAAPRLAPPGARFALVWSGPAGGAFASLGPPAPEVYAQWLLLPAAAATPAYPGPAAGDDALDSLDPLAAFGIASAPAPTPQAAVPPAAAASARSAERRDAARLVIVPGVAYVACSGWAPSPLADTTLARRFADEFAARPDAGAALVAAFGAAPAAAAACAAWVPDESGGTFAWSGGGAIYRLRGERLERLQETAPSAGGDSLADLVGAAPAADAAPGTATCPADVHDGDRWLLCADAGYARLAWGQLVSALREPRPADAAARLAEPWAAARVPAAIVLAFDETSEGLVATHAAVAEPAAAVA